MDLECTALNHTIVEYKYHPKKYKYDIETFLYHEGRLRLLKTLKHLKSKGFTNMKIQLSLQIQISRLREEETITITPWFHSQTFPIYNTEQINIILISPIKQVLTHWDGFIHLGSGWTVDEIRQLKLSVCKYHPLHGGAKCPKLPKILLNKHAMTSIVCPNDDCFIYSVLAALHPQKSNPGRFSKYKRYMKSLVIDQLTYPVSLKQISKFEKDNNLSINCYGYDTKIIYPLYVSHQKSVKEIDLLLYKGHYYLIRSLSRLLSSINCGKQNARYICRSCLSVYYTKSKLDDHKKFCDNDGQRYILPPSKTFKSFKNYRGQVLNDFVIYFDMEAALISEDTTSKASKLEKIGRHHPIAVGAKRVSIISKYDGDLALFHGTDCVDRFLQYLEHQRIEIQTIRWEEYKEIHWDYDTRKQYDETTHCELCDAVFSKTVKKTADHHHLKAKNNYRRALCNRCNLTYGSVQTYIPIIGHSALSYDVKHLLSVFNRKSKRNHVLKVLAKNKEKFQCVYMDRFMFIDSYSFLQGSLQILVESLRKKGEENFVYTKQFANTKKQFDLLLRKGVMMYEYIDNDFEQKLQETLLPKKEKFYDSLNDQSISDEQYKHAQTVFSEFSCKCVLDYILVYLSGDVLQLADVFTSFRDIFYKDYGLDATQYISLPQLAFDALLKESKVHLELISDIDMYNWITKSIRGGFSGILHREAVANHRYMASYDANLPDNYLFLFDVCNLYGRKRKQNYF